MLNTKLVFILINYFNENEVSDFVAYQLGIDLIKRNVDVVIVDNGSNNNMVFEQLKNTYPDIMILNPKKNSGYFGGANIGLKEYLKEYGMPAAVVVSNVDIEFVGTDFIDKLKSRVSENNFEVLGPDITSTFLGQKQNPYMKQRISESKIKIISAFSSNVLLYNMFLFFHFVKTKLKSFIQKAKQNESAEQSVIYGIHGSFMVFHNNYFNKGGVLEYPSFLFGEEIFVGEQCRKNGMKTVFEPSLKILHHEHSSTGIFKNKANAGFIHQSYQYLLKHYND